LLINPFGYSTYRGS